MVSVLDCQSRDSGFKPWPGQKFGLRFLLHLRPLANSAIMSALIVHCQWEGETVTSHPPSYTETKKMKTLTLHTHSCQRARLKDCSSSSSSLGLSFGNNLTIPHLWILLTPLIPTSLPPAVLPPIRPYSLALPLPSLASVFFSSIDPSTVVPLISLCPLWLTLLWFLHESTKYAHT